jgi:hypothetical protein
MRPRSSTPARVEPTGADAARQERAATTTAAMANSSQPTPSIGLARAELRRQDHARKPARPPLAR